jgi:23S rRNA maturation mini-RNase III
MDNSTYSKLTESARIALDETKQEIADKILEKAYKSALSKNTADKEISLSDIIEAKEEILYKRTESTKQDSKRKRWTLMLSMSGALYAVFGIVFYLYQNKNFDTTKDLGLIIAAIGIMMSVVAFYYNLLISRKKVQIRENNIQTERNYSEFEIVRRWQAIEKLGSELMRKEGVSDNKSRSINFIIQFLSESILSDNHSINLKQILLARNDVVHGGLKLTHFELETLTKKADLIIGELENKIKKH